MSLCSSALTIICKKQEASPYTLQDFHALAFNLSLLLGARICPNLSYGGMIQQNGPAFFYVRPSAALHSRNSTVVGEQRSRAATVDLNEIGWEEPVIAWKLAWSTLAPRPL